MFDCTGAWAGVPMSNKRFLSLASLFAACLVMSFLGSACANRSDSSLPAGESPSAVINFESPPCTEGDSEACQSVLVGNTDVTKSNCPTLACLAVQETLKTPSGILGAVWWEDRPLSVECLVRIDRIHPIDLAGLWNDPSGKAVAVQGFRLNHKGQLVYYDQSGTSFLSFDRQKLPTREWLSMTATWSSSEASLQFRSEDGASVSGLSTRPAPQAPNQLLVGGVTSTGCSSLYVDDCTFSSG
jgi:hypothetical protein